MDYSKKLKDPRWQRLRLEVMERDGFKCTRCGDAKSTLHVNHLKYTGDPWEAPMEHLETLCEGCHKWRTEVNLKFQLTRSRCMHSSVEQGLEMDDYADSVMRVIYDCMVSVENARADKSLSATGISAAKFQEIMDYKRGLACRLVMDGLRPPWDEHDGGGGSPMPFRNDTAKGKECNLEHLFFGNDTMGHEALVRGIANILGITFDRSRYASGKRGKVSP